MKKTTKVKIIRETLENSATQNTYGLDRDNIYRSRMEKMCGGIFTVKQSALNLQCEKGVSLWCEEAGRNFKFSMKDVKIIRDTPVKLPKPKTFNPKLLDV